METNVALVCINRIIYFSLAGAYGLLGLAIFIQLIRIQKRVPEYGWTTQKVDELGKIFDAFARDVFSPPPPPLPFFLSHSRAVCTNEYVFDDDDGDDFLPIMVYGVCFSRCSTCWVFCNAFTGRSYLVSEQRLMTTL